MYRCVACGALFDEPSVYPTRENLDGERGVETRTVESCPWCGDEWFEEVGDEEE